MWTAENFDPDLPFVITRMRGKGVEPCLKKRHKKPTAKKPSKATAKR